MDNKICNTRKDIKFKITIAALNGHNFVITLATIIKGITVWITTSE